MTQDERFEKWEREVKDHDTDFRETWHAALEPAELEFEQNTENTWIAMTPLGSYKYWRVFIVYGEKEKVEWYYSTSQSYGNAVCATDMSSAIQACRDHYRLAATRMINKLTGCTE